MASISKTEDGYRAQVYVKGVRENKRFRTKREAEIWAAGRETALRKSGQDEIRRGHTLRQALEKYAKEVSPSKRGGDWEQIRIKAFLRDTHLKVDAKIELVTTDRLSVWRDARLLEVSAGTVLREINLISAVLEAARREWKWISDNPMRDMRKPSEPAHRSVVISWRQTKAILRAFEYNPRAKAKTKSQGAALAFLVAQRTGMRAGELCGLEWDRVHEDYCVLPVTKTVPRDVPLTKKARKLIEKASDLSKTKVFNLGAASLDTLFRKAKGKAGIEGVTFHDSRHTAATWLAPRMDVLDLCKMFGWSNPKQAMTYYNPSASQIAARIKTTQNPKP
ncbi:MAG: site-specific integrase [Burkholderiaceae bacterium]|nr:site-specific integrase [Burkholderiaceae bacterium]